MLTQEDAARVMYAAEKWAKACGNRDGLLSDRIADRQATKQAFADLISQLVEPEPGQPADDMENENA